MGETASGRDGDSLFAVSQPSPGYGIFSARRANRVALSPSRPIAQSPPRLLKIDTRRSLNTLERLHEDGCILG